MNGSEAPLPNTITYPQTVVARQGVQAWVSTESDATVGPFEAVDQV